MINSNYPERLLIAAEQNVKEKEFWLDKLSGKLERSRFPYDYKDTGVNKVNIDSITFSCNEELVSKIMDLTRGADDTLNLLLMTGVILLLHKYTGSRNVMVGTPIYKQEIEGDFINTVLVLRNSIDSHVTFKEFILQVRQTITDAVENQNYPIELLKEKLDLDVDSFEESNPLFDVAVLLENIHDKRYLQQVSCSLVFSFRKETRDDSSPHITGTVEYNTLLYEKTTIEKLVGHFMNLLQISLFKLDVPLSHLEMLLDREKKQLLYDFNDTKAEYPAGKTIHQWFEEQVEKTPDKVAVCSPIDLDDIFDWLESGKSAVDLDKRLETCCFKNNPYIYSAHLELPLRDTGLKLLKTHYHNSVLVNHNTAELINLFDGKRNLKTIYHRVKALEEQGVKFHIYSMSMTDLLEVFFRFEPQPEIFTIRGFEDLLLLVQVLYRNHLIHLAGIDGRLPGMRPGEPPLGAFTKEESPGLKVEDIWRKHKHKEAPGVRVLLLGDTPGTPSTGLLYLGSYLMRKGIPARCQFYDPSTDYASMKENIGALLEEVQPGIVAVSLKWFLYIARVIDICKLVKEYAAEHSLDIKVVVGGNTASYYWQEIAAHDCIDYVVRGDGEEPLLKICRGEKEENIPNCIYKRNGEIVENPVTYLQEESNSREIYLSHLDELLLSNYTSLLGSFFIYTHKGCAMNCLYCGGCSRAQEKTYNRKKVLRRGVEEVRQDILAAQKYTSTFQFDFDIPDSNLVDYCKQIWQGIDLSAHFCIFATLTPPSAALIELVSSTFRYVYWDFDICTLSERHREQLFSLGLVKPQPLDRQILEFIAQCEAYSNIEVRLNLITGLPYFTPEDIEPGEKLLDRIMHGYSCFGELHWARLHAQPGAPILEDPGSFGMHSYASTFEEFRDYSRKNFNHRSGYAAVENIDYPYIYFNDDRLNSSVTNFYLESNRKIDQFKADRRRRLIAADILTYRQLDDKARHLAGILSADGVKPGQIVALLLERSLHIPAAILGVLKTGCAYLPLDPGAPGGRIEYMLRDSSAAALVTRPGEGGKVGKWGGKTFFLEDRVEVKGEVSSSLVSPPVSPADLVYVIYTSGTTGKPKGVLLKHENLVNYVHWFTKTANLTAGDKTILTASYAFDLGYTSLYSSLLNGCELHILSREDYLLAERLLDYIRQRAVTYLKVTPSLFAVIVNSPGFSMENCKTLRLAVVGGEAINVADIERAYSVCSHLQVMNHYGPTEATIGCVATFVDFHRFDEYKRHPVIGKPIFNSRVYILNKSLELLPVGVPGELCTAGTCLARGYLNRPELTAEKFNGSYKCYRSYIFYRTGDLARWLSDGTIEFLGRIDKQVKIRGYRIELGEIENRLLQHQKVKEAAVVVKEISAPDQTTHDGIGTQYLCAYFVPEKGEKIVKEGEFIDQSIPLINRFEETAEKDHNKIAVQANGRSLTYYTLNRHANRVARKILEAYDDRYKLSKSERTRYKRQMLLYGWGQVSQEKLKSTTVFVAGAGGGASPTITQLALAGVGTIKVCDFDEVELSNLNRQFLHDEERLGMNKALSAQLTVNRLNPNINVIPYTQKLTRENVAELVGDAAIIFDMFDGLADKFILSEYAVENEIPHVIISMTDINAYTTVCHTPFTPCFHCLFDKRKLETIVSGMQHYVENYSKNPLPVVSTSLFISTGVAVNEALKILLGFKQPAYNKFFYFNQRGEEENLVYTPGYKAMTYLFSDHFLEICREQGFDWETSGRGNFLEELTITPNPDCPLCGTKRKQKSETSRGKKVTESTPLGVGRENKEDAHTVALVLNRDVDMAVALIGALKSRKTFVPFDPVSSPESLSDMLEDSEARVIITDDNHLKLAEKLRDKVNRNIKIVNISGIDQKDGDQIEENFAVEISAGQTAYKFYSSDAADSRDFNESIMGLCRALLSGTAPYYFAFEDHQQKPGTDSFPRELREYLLKDLPDYMVPTHFVPLDKMPLTPNGKLNRKALPDPELKAAEGHQGPRNRAEEKLADIWSEVLGIERDTISINADFFELGGHSLRATIMVSKVHKELNVKLSVADVFKTPTIKGLSEFLTDVAENIYASIRPVEVKEYYPLSSAQMRMFLLSQIKGAATSDNISMAFMVKGLLDLKQLEDTFRRLIERHQLFRTSFQMVDYQPMQRIHETAEFKISHIEVDDRIGSITEQQIKDIIDDFIRPFNLSCPPLLRVGLLNIAEHQHLLLYDMHHIISDGTSFQIFAREFIHLYAGGQLPPLKIQYKDFTIWQNNQLNAGVFKRQEAYWLNVFSDEIPDLNLPTDYPRQGVQSFEGDFVEFLLDKPLIDKISEIAAEIGGTLYMALLAVYNILLHKYTSQEDIVVGSSSAGRPHVDLQNVIGFFVNTLAMRNYPKEEKSFLRFLEEVKTNALEAYANQDYQFDELVKRLGIQRDSGRQVLFDTHFTLHNIHVEKVNTNMELDLKDVDFTYYPIEEKTTQFDIIIHANYALEGILFTLRYSTKLFKKETIQRFANHYMEIARIVAEDKDIKLKDIKISHTLEAAQANMPQADFIF